jgi:hypothetical protein
MKHKTTTTTTRITKYGIKHMKLYLINNFSCLIDIDNNFYFDGIEQNTIIIDIDCKF